MSERARAKISFDRFDELRHPRPERCDFDQIVERAISRRSFLGGSVVLGTAAFVMGTSALSPARAESRFGFEQVAANGLDTITVPDGYSWHMVVGWGDPLWSRAPAFDQATRGSGASQELSFGDNNDGMALFQHGGRNILAVNNEYTNLDIMYGGNASKAPEGPDDVRKGKAAHGVSVVELQQENGRWSIVQDSAYNRRITADTPMAITGPARGHDLLKTAADPAGTIAATAARPGAPISPARKTSTATSRAATPTTSRAPSSTATASVSRTGAMLCRLSHRFRCRSRPGARCPRSGGGEPQHLQPGAGRSHPPHWWIFRRQPVLRGFSWRGWIAHA
jgi:hypothetical protein